MVSKVKYYYQLIKPGIVYGNILTCVAGFFVATGLHDVHARAFVGVVYGTALVVASACVINNYIDRDIDSRMQRTKKRVLVTDEISVADALSYAIALGILGFVFLGFLTNIVTLVIGLIGFIDYVVIYSYAKRRTIYGTLLGSISGAMPIVAGYTAITARFDVVALLLMLLMICWQMVHFYSIALYREKDYKKSGLAILPVIKGHDRTRLEILIYLFGFIIVGSLFYTLKYTNASYLGLMGLLDLGWLRVTYKGFIKDTDIERWARQMFFYSLVAVVVLSILLPYGFHVR